MIGRRLVLPDDLARVVDPLRPCHHTGELGDQIAEVDSHEHSILQAVDVVLGSMQFRLNDFHRAKPPGQARRGKKTIAKEKLYKRISQRIRSIYPNFNIGISTGGLVVIDVDEGATWLADQPDLALSLTIAPLSLTANAGRQHLSMSVREHALEMSDERNGQRERERECVCVC